jgi:hypothetical protein
MQLNAVWLMMNLEFLTLLDRLRMCEQCQLNAYSG